MRKDAPLAILGGLEIVGRLADEAFRAALQQPFGMFSAPWVVDGQMVGDEVQHQPQSALAQPVAKRHQSLVAAQRFINAVVVD